MSATICQGQQSCLESVFLEPRAVIDNLAPPRSNFIQSIPWTEETDVSQEQREQKDNSCRENRSLIFNRIGFGDGEHQSNKDGDLCWSIMQALANSNTSSSREQVSQAEEEQVYVHPLAKRSSSTLSTQSLEMCTEGLGSETGSNNDEIADLSCLTCEKQSSEGIQRSRSRKYPTNKLEKHGNLPPPLTLIRGSDGIQLRPHREGGRLVLKAVTFCSKSCFQAERTDGRLRLFSSSKDGYTNSDEEISQHENNIQSEELEHENAAEEQDSNEEDTDAYPHDGGGKRNYPEEEGMEGRGGKLECEIDAEEFPRPSRCKEEGPRNRGLQSWEPFWVPIS